MVGPSGFVASSYYWLLIMCSVSFSVGLGKKEKKLILVLGNIVFHCHVLRAPVERLERMILATTEGVFVHLAISRDFERRTNPNPRWKSLKGNKSVHKTKRESLYKYPRLVLNITCILKVLHNLSKG